MPDVSVRHLDQTSPKISYHIDQPGSWRDVSRCVIVRGWSFEPNEKPIAGIRLIVSQIILDGVVGQFRPDVRLEFPAAGTDYTGFEIRGILPKGTHDLVIEAQTASTKWVPIFRTVVQVHHDWLPLWLGGGAWTELMFFQMPGHMKYSPRALKAETFPALRRLHPELRFSIVTPSFQQGRYVRETMSSVTRQNYGRCEYVVQDGGSTDGSVEVIRAYAEDHRNNNHEPRNPTVLSWESTRDNGQADAIARAFDKTSGEPEDIMAWINSDDFYMPGAFGCVANYFAAHPNIDVVYGHRILVDEQSREIGRWFLPQHDNEVLKLNDFVPQETLFWRRRIWNKVSGMDTSFKFAMDWDLLLRFQAAGAQIARIPYFLACFRIHPVQKTSSAMHDVGQKEITLLRERTQGRVFPSNELETNPLLLSYLRKSAWIEFLWNLGLRAK